MSDQKKQQKDEHDVDEDELEQQKGEELPDREVMSIIDPGDGRADRRAGPTGTRPRLLAQAESPACMGVGLSRLTESDPRAQ